MKDPLYRLSVASLSVIRRLEGGFCFGLALSLVGTALWLTLWAGLNWLVIGIDIFLGIWASELFVKACTAYSTSQQPERADERERYLQSRALYNPGSKRDDRRRERGS